jgi:hypothetical protein
MEYGKSTLSAGLDASFGLDDALRLKQLLEGQMSNNHNESISIRHGNENSCANVTTEIGRQHDLGSWTPLDLKRQRKVQISLA